MKKLLVVFLMAMSLIGCETSTPQGQCIGVIDDPDPTLQYRASGLNLILAVVFVETLVVPAYVILADLKCPVGLKKK